MANEIRPIQPGIVTPKEIGAGKATEGAGSADSPSFKDLLKQQIDKVNQLQIEADRAAENLATGKTDNIAEVMTAVRKAELAFNMLMQVRNKVVSAYEEIMRMRI